MKGWFFWILAIPFFLNGEIAWQADVQKPFALSIKLSSDHINLNEFLNLDAEFRYPSSYQVNIESLIDQLGWSANPLAPLMEVYQTTASSLQAEEGMIGQRLHAIIRPLQQGTLNVSFLNISFEPKEKGQKALEILTPVFAIQVEPANNQIPLVIAPLIPLEPEFPLGLTEANREFLWDSPERHETEKRSCSN